MRLFWIVFCVFSTFQVSAQIGSDFEKRNSRKKNDSPFSDQKTWGYIVWSENASHYRPIGWHVDLGLTYMAGNSPNDTDSSYSLRPTGLPGYYLEGGMEHLFKKKTKLFHYFDWGLGIKHFGGQELYRSDSLTDRGNFNFGNVFLRAAIHNVSQFTKSNFIDQSIGINLDYRIYGGNDQQLQGKYLSPLNSVNQNKLVLQLHYSIGWGIKLRDGLFVVPTLQTPVLTLVDWKDFNPSHSWFNSRYQPIIFTVKLAWLWPKSGCPPVFNNDGQSQSDQYQMQ